MKIALTGGPSAGKTSVVDILYRTEWFNVVVVQEAASLLYRGGFPRRDDEIYQRCQQRAIYHVQRELEEIGAVEALHRNLVCDRGSLDGLAYWPGTEETFFRAMGTSMAREIERYDWIIHLDTANAENYQSSAIRREDSGQAVEMNSKVKQAWRLHPNRIIIPNSPHFMAKVDATLRAVKMMLDGQSVEKICSELSLARS